MLAEAFDEHCDRGLYTSKCHLLHDMMDDERRLGTESVLNSSPYELLIVHINQHYKGTLESRRTRIMENVSVMERSYYRVLSYEKEKDDGKLGRRHEKLASIERGLPYVLRDGIIITVHEMA